MQPWRFLRGMAEGAALTALYLSAIFALGGAYWLLRGTWGLIKALLPW